MATSKKEAGPRDWEALIGAVKALQEECQARLESEDHRKDYGGGTAMAIAADEWVRTIKVTRNRLRKEANTQERADRGEFHVRQNVDF